MRPHPFRAEIIGTLVLAPLVIGLETWRRWGDLLSPAALDDALVFGAALIVVWRLARRDRGAPRLWLFVCGGAWFLFCLSLWGSVYGYSDGDPSGFPVWSVIAFKVVGFALISWASGRALRKLDAFSISPLETEVSER